MNSNQLRQDLVSGDWIVISPGRKKKPNQSVKKNKRKKTPKSKCLFEDPKKVSGSDPVLIYGGKDWQLVIVKNKYPAFFHKEACSLIEKKGPYSVMEAIGHHELVITRDHDKNFVELSADKARQVFEAFRERYRMFLKDKCVEYVSIFHNWGPKAGASVYHPHYQIIAIPVIPPDVSHSLNGSNRYFKECGKCVHCVMMESELKEKKRVIFENAGAIAFSPFVSRDPFEVRIFPKKHLPYLEDTSDEDLGYIVEALQFSLKKIKKNLNDPDYNFFIHTAPIKNKDKYGHYHWHVEVLPKISINAGFELGTGIQINDIDPDEAAALLRK
jgi:UDPglucose--hexose-1-phosphate uridylyltransferase